MDIIYNGENMKMLCDEFPEQTILFRLTDVRDKKMVEQSFEEVHSKFHSIDCVVACAGVLNERDYQLTVEVNLVMLFFIYTRKTNQF